MVIAHEDHEAIVKGSGMPQTAGKLDRGVDKVDEVHITGVNAHQDHGSADREVKDVLLDNIATPGTFVGGRQDVELMGEVQVEAGSDVPELGVAAEWSGHGELSSAVVARVYRTSHECFLLSSSRARKVRRVLLLLVVSSWLIHSWIFSMAGLRILGIRGVCTGFYVRVD